MRDNTYHRWITWVGRGTPSWDLARAHVRALSRAHLREENGELCEWVLIDEALGFDQEHEEPLEELASARAQLSADLADLRGFWVAGHSDVTDETNAAGRTLLAGGELGPDWEYPNHATGCLARLIGSGTARAAGFRDDLGSEPLTLPRQERHA